MNKSFTIADALNIQSKHMEEWKEKLNEKCYSALKKWVDNQNSMGYESAFDVVRGCNLDEFVANWSE